MLAGPGFGDQLGSAHAGGQQRLAEHVVRLVSAAVQQVLAFQDQRASPLAAEPLHRGDRRWAAGEFPQQAVEFMVENGVVTAGEEGLLHRCQRGHQQLRHVAAAEFSETS